MSGNHLDTQQQPGHATETAIGAGEGEGDALQARLLAGVSRTFALTIPQLPPGLHEVVANAYLLCRIVDTIEDDPVLDLADKRLHCQHFVAALEGRDGAATFARTLADHLTGAETAEERELVAVAPQVIGYTRSLPAQQRQALIECVRIMADGMLEMQQKSRPDGLADTATMNRYCYFVAGVVGEMLTRLFCDYSPVIRRHGDRLMALAPSFGQGLQMTNILKDVWEDRARGVCWLPRDVFNATGFDLGQLGAGGDEAGFRHGMERLVGMAHGHLRNALQYTLLVPRDEQRIRNFCLWGVGMALLSLQNIHRKPGFRSGQEVKISRRSVRATVLLCRIGAGHDRVIRGLFRIAATGLPLDRSVLEDFG